jgi:hypothetical protein
VIHLAAAATSGASPSVLTAHLWHILEAVAFLVMSLGGIAVAEFVQSRNRSNVAHFRAGSLGGHETESWGTDAFASADVQLPLNAANRRVTLLPLVALAGAGAAGVHAVVMPDHFMESWLYGSFFLCAAIGQFAYSAWLLLRPSRELVIAGVAGNLSIVVLWLVTRTIGIPLGPAAGAVEKVGALDALAGVFELTTVIGGALLLWQWRPTPARPPSSWSPWVWALGAVSITAIVITAVVAPPS